MGTTTNPISPNSNGHGRSDLTDATTDVAQQLNVLKDDFAGLAAAVQNLTGTGAAVAKGEAKAKIAAASEAGEIAAHHAIGQANEGAAAVARYAREKPMVALAAAAGAGLLIGLLTSPRK